MTTRALALALVTLAACSSDDATDDASTDTTTDAADTTDNSSDNSSDDSSDDNGAGEPAELAGITRLHNEVRAAVNTGTPLPPMTWNADLAATARAWATSCTDNEAPAGLVDHNENRSDGHPYYVGENVFGSSGGATAAQAVGSWASEEADYNPATNGCSGVCGHYTQIVWRDSVELGCALATCAGLTYGSTIVCNYGPGGNSGGRPY